MRNIASRRSLSFGVALAVGGLALSACNTNSTITRYLAGGHGLILKTTNSGVNWTPQASGTTKSLRGVSFDNSPSDGLVVGDGGVILKTTSGGSSWVAEVSHTKADLNSVTHYAVFFCISFPICYPVGEGAIAVGNEGVIVGSSDGGATWATQVSGTKVNLNAVDSDGGSSGTIDAVGDNGVIRETTNQGVSWTTQTSGTKTNLNGIANRGLVTYAVGSDGLILKTTNGGTTWTPQVSGTKEKLHSVAFFNDTHGYAVGAEGTILRTNNGGIKWDKLVSGTTRNLRSVTTAVTSDDGFVVGDDGTILITTNGTQPSPTWTKETSGTTRDLFGNA
jgi:photosystem II stability/assembly factor-like uncharacterized protein